MSCTLLQVLAVVEGASRPHLHVAIMFDPASVDSFLGHVAEGRPALACRRAPSDDNLQRKTRCSLTRNESRYRESRCCLIAVRLHARSDLPKCSWNHVFYVDVDPAVG